MRPTTKKIVGASWLNNRYIGDIKNDDRHVPIRTIKKITHDTMVYGYIDDIPNVINYKCNDLNAVYNNI